MIRSWCLPGILCAFAVGGCGGANEEPVPVAEGSPEHATPYAIGSSTFFIHDGSRGFDVPAGVNTGIRTISVSGGYWWPNLKPNTQARYFDPGTEFVPVDVAKAHEPQKMKALAFFDPTIRLDESAIQRLLDQSFADDGLVLESRNF